MQCNIKYILEYNIKYNRKYIRKTIRTYANFSMQEFFENFI